MSVSLQLLWHSYPCYFFERLGSIVNIKPLTQNICTCKSNNCTYLFYSFPSCDLNGLNLSTLSFFRMFPKLIRYFLGSDCDVGGLRVFHNRVLRSLQEPTTKQQIWQGRKVHDEDLHNLYSSPRLIKLRMMWAGNIPCIEETRNTYKILGDKP